VRHFRAMLLLVFLCGCVSPVAKVEQLNHEIKIWVGVRTEDDGTFGIMARTFIGRNGIDDQFEVDALGFWYTFRW